MVNLGKLKKLLRFDGSKYTVLRSQSMIWSSVKQSQNSTSYRRCGSVYEPLETSKNKEQTYRNCGCKLKKLFEILHELVVFGFVSVTALTMNAC